MSVVRFSRRSPEDVLPIGREERLEPGERTEGVEENEGPEDPSMAGLSAASLRGTHARNSLPANPFVAKAVRARWSCIGVSFSPFLYIYVDCWQSHPQRHPSDPFAKGVPQLEKGSTPVSSCAVPVRCLALTLVLSRPGCESCWSSAHEASW